MSELKIQDKDIVVPGEVVAEGLDFLPSYGTYRLGDKILANRLGLIKIEGKVIKLIPLSGKYLPKKNDVIVGKVIDVNFSGWRIDTNSAYSAMLGLKDATSEFVRRGADLTKFFDINEYVVAQIINVTSQNLIDLTTKGPGLRKLRGGRIININPNKVPRVIGKQGSMVTMIKQATGCQIIVGQNGVIWLEGSPQGEIVAVRTIEKIEKESHISGLTERVQKFLEENKVEVKGELK
jgi:exosome complex component RRP4